MTSRTVAISGAASGIGQACAQRLAADGHRVIGVDRHFAEVVADLGTPQGRRQAVDQVAGACEGRLDGLVTCAGLAGAPGRAGSLLVSVNYFGTVALLEGLRPLMAARPRAAAVAISSHAATIQPDPPLAVTEACLAGEESRAMNLADAAGSLDAYSATKLAVARWVRRHAPTPDWAGAGITLNALAPGMTETPMVDEGRADPQVAPLFDLVPIPVGHTGRPEELAALIAFLLGPDGAYLCGSVIVVDGGTEALVRPDDWPSAWNLSGDPGLD